MLAQIARRATSSFSIPSLYRAMAGHGAPHAPILDDLRYEDAPAVLKQLQEGATTIVDVRRPDEWDKIRLKNTLHIPLDSLLNPESLDKVIHETINKIEGPVCVTCFQSKKRGPAGASAIITRLKELGYDAERITVLKNGVEGVSNDAELAEYLEGTDVAAPASS